MNQFSDFEAKAIRVAEILRAKDVEERYCRFSADPVLSNERIWAPGQAMTKFQMEQAMGDWAEDTVRAAINVSRDFKAIAFGDNDKMLSEDDSFADLYRAGKRQEMEFGKRSDLLLFEARVKTPAEASKLSGPEAERLCRTCLAGLEVRSSRTSVQIFRSYQQQQIAIGKKPARAELSYTVKIEDLQKVFRWIARNQKPIVYIQVFFDELHALNFGSVFDFIIDAGAKLKLEKPSRSAKPTIMIPLSRGLRIGEVAPPEFSVVHNQLANGRHDNFPKPHGGGAEIDIKQLLRVL